MTIDQAIEQAIGHHQAGRFAQAEGIYRQVLAAQPNHADALNLLGLLAAQAGQRSTALELIGKAIAIQPGAAPFYNNLGTVLMESGRFDDAIAAFERAIALQPKMVPAYNNLGNALSYQARFADAVSAYQRAIALKPDLAEAHSNLGNVLREQALFVESEAACRTAIKFRPEYAQAHSNLGNALRDQGRLREAVDAYQRAIQLQPNFPASHNNLGVALRAMGDFKQAAAAHRRALELDPNYAEAHLNLAFLELLAGNFENGFAEHEWLWKRPGFAGRDFGKPRWRGEDIAGKTVLIYGEHGLGDTIQFIRYAPLLAARGAKVIIECQPVLHRLLNGFAGTEHVIARGQPLPEFDLVCPVMGLPCATRTRIDSIPAEVPYLFALEALRGHWRKRLEPYANQLKVGIVWAGNAAHKNDRNRSIPLQHFAPLANLPGVQFFSLQKSPPANQASPSATLMELIDYTPELNDMADTAALIAELDLVITVDTSVAHVAGALGKPVWMLIAFDPDWRWLLDREDSPWYPTVRLFRQRVAGDWTELVERVAAALAMLLPVSN